MTLRPLNPFRFMTRLFTILGAVRYVLLLLFAGFLVLLVLLYLAERHQPFENSPHSFADTLYLAAVTALTVGYGDLVPHTVAGRCLSLLMALQGITLTGVIAAAAVRALEEEYRESPPSSRSTRRKEGE
jgi:voltage-gated potassium channel